MVEVGSYISFRGNQEEKTMKTFVLIGGKDADHSNNFNLEEKILKTLGLTHPNILYIPIAYGNKKLEKMASFESYFNLGEVKSILSLEDEQMIEKLSWADVIYFSGGSASKLYLEVFGSKLEEYMKKDTNKVWMGISAGAILLSKAGMGDQNAYLDKGHMYQYQMVKGLGLLDMTICPHYNHDGLWCYNDLVYQYGCDGYALEDETAIIFSDNIKVIKNNKSRSVYRFDSLKKEMIPLYGEVL